MYVKVIYFKKSEISIHFLRNSLNISHWTQKKKKKKKKKQEKNFTAFSHV
jgi:hypothetical protein